MSFIQFKSYFRFFSFFRGLIIYIIIIHCYALKIYWRNEILVKALGVPHGILFVLYIIACVLLKSKMKWDTITTFILLSASIIPFGTFYVDYKYLK